MEVRTRASERRAEAAAEVAPVSCSHAPTAPRIPLARVPAPHAVASLPPTTSSRLVHHAAVRRTHLVSPRR
jgi:hypothetical protein